MRKIFLFCISIVASTQAYVIKAQVGINSLQPLSTLDVRANDQVNPSNVSGIIIPKVTSLNTTEVKEIGLLVFLNSSTLSDRGFYWWDGMKWNPFISTSKITNNKTITYVTAENSFAEGEMNQNASTDTRTLKFSGIKTNDIENFSINTNGELLIKKAGYYYVQAASFILKNTSTSRRDQLDMKIFVNGNNASNSNAENFNLEGSKSYPTGIATIAINVAGLVKLSVNDRISMKVVRSYRDTDPNDAVSIIPDPNTKSNLTLRYLGNF
ncbi:hypothetical protein HX001_03005 [Empedobacter brevis]|uniref:C1q domain-containing protein n=1 Tax=Empedobacter brevis TaxID=247 RepID=A0AAJ1QCC7_9FLAO|nr:hypothetical protein [Empedobacter brevis]MDM1071459.1 hypothetical protein [Empedobacter brevis]QHC85614.1 hypothetical protein AS589_12860 [Empedobacter brevis]